MSFYFLNFYRGKINENNYGKAFAVKIQCRPNRDLLDLYPQIATEITKVAKEKTDERLNSAIMEVLNEEGTPRVISDLMRILRSIGSRISIAGHGPLFILIDEFENALPTVEYDERKVFLPEQRRIGAPQAINQLDSLTQLSGMGFVVVMRKEFWNEWKTSVESRVNKYDKSLIIELADLSKEDIKQLIVHRLESPSFRKKQAKISPPDFDESLIKLIWERTKGNPRNVLRLANRVFRRAVTKGVKTITSEFLDAG